VIHRLRIHNLPGVYLAAFLNQLVHIPTAARTGQCIEFVHTHQIRVQQSGTPVDFVHGAEKAVNALWGILHEAVVVAQLVTVEAIGSGACSGLRGFSYKARR